MNVIVNKEKQYGVIWHSKCACTTLTHIFCQLNEISLNGDVQKKRSLNFNIPNKHHFNNYLQNIDLISFYRDPYHRFISTFIDKHVYKTDDIYITLEGYHNYLSIYKKDTIYNLTQYLLQGGYISEHFRQISDSAIFHCYKNNISNCICKLINMKHGVNLNLYEFLKQYYDISLLDSLGILECHENSIATKQRNVGLKTNNIVFQIDDKYDYEKLKHFDEMEWKEYLSTHNLDYEYILQDTSLKDDISILYKKDIIQI